LKTRIFLRSALAALAFAGAWIPAPAAAAVTAFFSAGTTCGGPASANFVTNGAPVKASLCVTTTTEPLCGATIQLRSASAAEDGRFFVNARTLGSAFPDASSVPLAFPVPIVNPPAALDLGGTTNLSTPSGPAANVLLATFDLAAQANATNNTYVISLGGFSAIASDPANCLAGTAMDLPITATFTLNRVAPPVITSASSATFTVNTPNSFTVTATGSPSPTFSIPGGAPSGVSINPTTGVLGGSPALGTVGKYTFSIVASNSAGSDSRLFSLTVIKADQAITFNAPPAQSFSPTPFGLTASASSGLAVSFSSTTPAVCSVSGSSVTMLTAGTCTIQANQPGSVDYNAAPPVSQSFTINAVAPSAPTLTAATPSNGAATLSFNPPANFGGTPITGYVATCNPGAITGTGAVSPIVVGSLANGTPYTCSVAATNAIGTGASSNTLSVTPTGAATVPVITSPGSATFTVTQAGTFTVVGTGNPAPTLSVSGPLPAGVTFTPATGVLAGTPALNTVGTYPLTFSATNASGTGTQSFVLTVQKASQSITFTPPPGQPFTTTPIALSATSTSGLTVVFSSATPAVCAVSGTSLTMVSAGTCTVLADQAGNLNYNPAPTVQGSFTITAALPGAPGITSIGAFTGAALVYFTAPASNGGSAITAYTVTCNPGAITATDIASPVRVTGLANGTLYSCTVTATNAAGPGPPSAPASVTPVLVTSFSGPSATGTGTITASFTGGGPGCGFTSARFIPVSGDPDSPPAPPAGVVFPHGLFDFVLGGCAPGATITMQVVYPTPLTRGTNYWKYGPRPTLPSAHWYILPSSLSSQTMVFVIPDGGTGDDDLLANGIIVDQGGPGVSTANRAIPMLSPWMLALLGLLVAGFGLRRAR
jgi:hypothetical protein